jgi:predicted nucleic acid-binding protein
MKVFFDTSVLVAASVGSHPHHAQALPALRRVANCKLRPLGLSTLRDRVCMTAAMLVLEPTPGVRHRNA